MQPPYHPVVPLQPIQGQVHRVPLASFTPGEIQSSVAANAPTARHAVTCQRSSHPRLRAILPKVSNDSPPLCPPLSHYEEM